MKPEGALASLGRALLAAIPLGFLGVFFVFPVLTILWRGIAQAPADVLEVVTSGAILSIGWFTLWQALASTVLSALVALPLTWALARYRFRGRRLVRALVTVPFVLPTVVVAGAFIALFDRLGVGGLRHTVAAVLAAHVFFNIAVFVRTVGGFWSGLDPTPEHAAQVLGATRLQAFREATLPRLRPAILSAFSIVFLFTFTSFGIVLLLGGPRMATVETEIYRYAVNRLDPGTAAVLGIVQLVAVLALVAFNARLSRVRFGAENFARDYAVAATGRRHRVLIAVTVAATLSFVLAPIAALVEQSVRFAGGYSFEHYRSLADRPRLLPVSPLAALRNSIQFALAATGIAVIVGGLASLVIVHGRRGVSRVLDLGLLLPLGTSAVTLGFGMLIALDEPPLDLRASWWIVPIAQALIGIPFVIRSVVPVLRSVDDEMREAAASLGASPRRVWREIDGPLAFHALGIGAGFAFAISLGEFGATFLVGRRGDLLTMPLAIERLLGQPGDLLRAQAMALAVILMMVTTVAMLIADRSNRGAVL